MARKTSKKPRQKKYTIAILYHDVAGDLDNTYAQEHKKADEQTHDVAFYIANVVKKAGSIPKFVAVKTHNVSAMQNIRADYIFNLVDSKAMEMPVARVLKRLSIPHSGSAFAALQTSNNKIKTKYLFTKAGIPTPPYTIIKPGDKITRTKVPGKFPIIVKPAFEHCSIGISMKSIARTYVQFQTIVRMLRKQFNQTLLAESFIKGEEVQISILERQGETIALPAAQLTSKKKPSNPWNMYGYDEKWEMSSEGYQNAAFVAPPKSIDKDSIVSMQRDAIRAFYALGFRDYGRFDARFDPTSNKWYFLEGNANPSITVTDQSGDAGYESIIASGMSVASYVQTIIQNSIKDFPIDRSSHTRYQRKISHMYIS